MSEMRQSQLSAPKQQLLALIRQMDFGFIEHLVVKSGEPILELTPKIMRDVKFTDEVISNAKHIGDNYVLKQPMVKLFCFLEEIGDGTIERLEIRHGLPFRILIEGIGNHAKKSDSSNRS